MKHALAVVALLLGLIPSSFSSEALVVEEALTVLQTEAQLVSELQDGWQAPKPRWKQKLVERLHRRKRGKVANQKLMALALALALGPFGVHRLYLGTETHVPVFYALTLGGGFGLLPACDIIAMLLCKDLDKYINSSRFIMWTP